MRTSSILFLIIITCLCNVCAQQPCGVPVEDFGTNPGNLKMFVHHPPMVDAHKMPMVVVLHGCGESAHAVAELTGWNKLADLHGFVVLYVQQKLTNNPSLCFNWYNVHDIEKGRGECASIAQMIAFAQTNYAIDSTQLFITGLSAGAAMSVVMAATYPATFKAAAIFAGGAYKIATNPIEGMKVMMGKKEMTRERLLEVVLTQNPDYTGTYPQLIVYHGLQDPIVDFKNAHMLVTQWTGVHHANAIPDTVERAYMGVADITRTTYTNTKGDSIVKFYEISNLGHKLLIQPGTKPHEGGQLGLFGVNKGYHATYHTAKDFGLIR